MKIKFTIFFLAITLAMPGIAQDEKAVKLLNELSSKTKAYDNFSANFTMNLVDLQSDIDLKREGKITVSDDMYRVKLDDDVIISNGDTRWTYQAESNEVYVDYEVEDDASGINPSKIFTIWESGFKQSHGGTATVKGRTVDQINLHPIKAAETNYHTVKVFVDAQKIELVKVEVVGKEGDTYIYELLDFKNNQTLSDGTFEFNKANFPGVEVVDLR